MDEKFKKYEITDWHENYSNQHTSFILTKKEKVIQEKSHFMLSL